MMSFGGNNDISGIFSHPIHPERNQEREEEIPGNESGLENTGGSFEGTVYNDVPEEREEALIPEEPVKKARVKNSSQENKDGLLIHSVTSKISEEDKKFIDDLTTLLGSNIAGAIRQCISDVREAKGEEITRAAQKIRRIMNQK